MTVRYHRYSKELLDITVPGERLSVTFTLHGDDGLWWREVKIDLDISLEDEIRIDDLVEKLEFHSEPFDNPYFVIENRYSYQDDSDIASYIIAKRPANEEEMKLIDEIYEEEKAERSRKRKAAKAMKENEVKAFMEEHPELEVKPKEKTQ